MSLVLSALLAVLGACGLTLAFAVGDLVVPVVAGAVVSTAVSGLVTGRLRLGPSITAVGALAALAGVGALLGVASVDGLRHGARLVNGTAGQVAADEVTLTVPFVLAGLAALVGAELVLRSRSAAAPVVPSAVAMLLGLLVVQGTDDVTLLPSVWAALALVTIGWRQRRARMVGPEGQDRELPREVEDGSVRSASGAEGEDPEPRPRSRQLLSATALLAVLVATAGSVALVAGTTGHQALADQQVDRFSPDLGGDDPEDDPEAYNPLTRVTTLWSGEDHVLFEVDSSAPVDRWRLAVLDEYDGISWRPSQRFQPVGEELPGIPEALAPDPDRREEPLELTQTVTPTDVGRDVAGSRMPVVVQPRSVTVEGDASLGFHPESGTMEAGGPLPASYEVVSDVARPDDEALTGADVASDPEARAATELPDDVPDGITERAEAVVEGVESPYDQAQALTTWLAGYELDFESPPSGHSYGHLQHFLFDPAGGRASPERFAAAHALMARSVGLPARVVVGFDGLGAAGETELTSWLATAWVEVKLEGVGWVPIDPLPAPAAEGQLDEDADQEVAGSDEALDEAGDEAGEDDEQTDEDEEAGDRSDGSGAAGDGGFPTGLVLMVGVAVLGLLVLASPALSRRWRRRRLGQGPGPAERVAGAWAATLDVLTTAGVPVTDDLGALDVVSVADAHGQAGADDLLSELALLVNRAFFAPVDLDERAATRAWRLRDEFAGRHRRARTFRQALREYFTGR